MPRQKVLQTPSKRLRLVLLFFFIFGFPIWSEEKKYSLDYIYVNANTGQSSGGHSAIRLGDLVYHFQYFPDKIFHIVREPWQNFHYIYGIQENRTIFIRKIILTKGNFDFFLSRMNEIYLIQRKELDNLMKLDNDVKILESVLYGDKTFHLKASGYFSRKITKHNSSYGHLHKKIVAEFGNNFILQNLYQTRKKIYNFNFINQDIPNSSFATKKYPKTVDNFSSEYLELVSLLQVFSILQENNELELESIFETSSGDLAVDEKYLMRLPAFLETVEEEILTLLKSSSNNKGYPLLVNIARYLVIQKSMQERKIYFLDSFGKNQTLVIGEVLQQKKFLDKINNQLSKKVNESFVDFIKEDNFTQRNYNVVEDIVNRKREILDSLIQSKPIRVNFERMLPSKEEDSRIEYNQSSPNNLKLILNQAIANRGKYQFFLQNKYSFNLFNKNCTTEIFHSINSFFEKGDLESSEKLGGVVKGNDLGVFVPFYAYYAVKKNYNVFEEVSIPSLRSRILKKNSDKGILFSMKESSTISSSFYKFNPEDSIFIFFTDDATWQRPLFGFVNLIAGIGELGYGIAISPLDNGEKIIKGLQGIFFSAPEIVFFNVRKGTFIYEADFEWQEIKNFADQE